MFYALAHLEDSFFAENMFTFVALDPCTIDVSEGTHIYEDGLFHLADYGIYAFNGPTWDQDIKTICDNFDEEICDYFSAITGGEATSVQTELHWAQNSEVNRYQEYAPDYMQGETITDLIPIWTIDTVPISMWSGMRDTVCSHQQALITKDIIGERVTKFVSIPWATHGWWGGKYLTWPYYQMFKEALRNPESKSFDTTLMELL